MPRKTISMKALKGKRGKIFHYIMMNSKKKSEDGKDIYMIKVSDRQTLQSSEFGCIGELLDCIKDKLVPELEEAGGLKIGYIVVDLPRSHKTYILKDGVISDYVSTI